MFRSTKRAALFPQSEHARLAGAIALAWGNEQFQRPALPFASFVAGVTLHDRGYGLLDSDGIGEGTPERWLELQLAGFRERSGDPVVDLVAALHVYRLMSKPRDPSEAAALPELCAELPRLREAAGVRESDAANADRITDLCDRAAFDFCFEAPGGGSVAVMPAPGVAIVEISYRVDGEGSIALAPWPLGVLELSGIIFAYRAEGYPEVLDPVVVPYRVVS